MNDAKSIVALGRMTMNGLGMPPDPAAAVALYTKASALKDADAMGFLGDAYTKGRGVPMDIERGEQWNTLGAEYGDWMSAHNIGIAVWSRE